VFRLLELESPAPHRPKQGTRLLSLGLKPRVLRRGSDKDPLYKDFAGHQQAFQWHEDCFQLPEGAVALAHHIQGFNQAFRYGQHAYGLQYHIELTENMLDVWLHDPPMKNDKLSSIQLPR
jgi:GMP synthase (glutamine-hydrolysing)